MALSAPSLAPMDRIHITNLEVSGILGIKPEEQANPQTIRVNAVMWVDTAAASASDDIADAVNYRTVAKAMIAHIEGGRPFLVERLARELADLTFALDSRIEAVEITLEKPGALRHAESVGITIHRTRSDSRNGAPIGPDAGGTSRHG